MRIDVPEDSPLRRINATPQPPSRIPLELDTTALAKLIANFPGAKVLDSEGNPITSITFVAGMVMLGTGDAPYTISGEQLA
jgi:hypothetical protein